MAIKASSSQKMTPLADKLIGDPLNTSGYLDGGTSMTSSAPAWTQRFQVKWLWTECADDCQLVANTPV